MQGRVATVIKDSLFPYFCAECGQEGEWWCRGCRPRGSEQQNIRAGNELENVTALFYYRKNHSLEKLIHDFKYNYVGDLRNLWREVINETELRLKEAVIIAVPLHKRRERERGYNQSLVIAEMLSAKLNYPILHGLERVRPTLQQAKLDPEERRINVRDAFVWKGEKPPESVILVDDVYTTGATMNECAKALKKAGTKEVNGFVLAHG